MYKIINIVLSGIIVIVGSSLIQQKFMYSYYSEGVFEIYFWRKHLSNDCACFDAHFPHFLIILSITANMFLSFIQNWKKVFIFQLFFLFLGMLVTLWILYSEIFIGKPLKVLIIWDNVYMYIFFGLLVIFKNFYTKIRIKK